MTPDVDLVYFEGCPHVEAVRAALRAALLAMGFAPEWKEWDLDNPETLRAYKGTDRLAC